MSWIVSTDGFYCPKCWEGKLEQSVKKVRENLEKTAKPVNCDHFFAEDDFIQCDDCLSFLFYEDV